MIIREQINQILPVVNIIPLTSRKSQDRIIYPNEVFIPKESANLSADSIALCYQIRTVDKKRLKKEIGCIHDESLIQQIHEAIRFQLKL